MRADPQKCRVYSWEGQFADWNSTTLKLRQARQYVHWACELYGVIPPAVVQHSGKEYSYSEGNRISFQTGQVNRAIALHEAAHYICDRLFDWGMAHHSPQWLSVYLWLLIRARIAPRVALTASAKAKKLNWIPLWQVSPRRLARALPKYHTKRRLTPPPR